ncbi:MAG TPA: Holliday junction resolvase RuvX [Thermomicrobiales bacterium]
MGIDVGSRRIGVAVSDELGLLAAPWRAVPAAHGKEFDDLTAMAREREIEIIVIGLPMSLNGTEGPQAKTVRAFARRLNSHLTDIPFVFADERFTTAEAERMMIAQKMSREQRRARIDAAAAAIMLQGWLDMQRPPQLAWREEDEY